jgi:hypothetical protein
MPQLIHINQAITVATGGFAPTDIAGLVAWYDASDLATITEASGAVSQWDDKSGNGYHLTQGTGANQPITGTRTQNSLNAIDFDGSDWLEKTGISSIGGNAHTWFVVLHFDTIAGGGNNGFFSLRTTGSNDWNNPTSIRHCAIADTNISSFYDSSARSTKAVAATNSYVIGIQRNGDSHVARVNGSAGTTATGLGTTAFTINEIGVGAANGHADNLDGYIAEVLWYNSALSGGDITTVESYLNSKWSVF